MMGKKIMKKKKGFLVIAHGSRKDEANHQVFTLVRRLRDYFQSDMFETAFMELASPSIKEGIMTLIKKGMDELIVSPFFLFTGAHYSEDVPGLIRDAIEEADKMIDFKMLKPVGKHPDIFNLVQEILYEEVADQLEYKHVPPSMIEQRSMEMIENFLNGDDVPEDQKPVIRRVIHATGDFDFMRNNEKYSDFGWASARLDDLANYIPARISGFLIPVASLLCGKDCRNSFTTVFRDYSNHPSPNSGIPEAAVAGALGVQLGGLNYYCGIPSTRPFIGERRNDFSNEHIKEANKIMIVSSLLMLVSGVTMYIALKGL